MLIVIKHQSSPPTCLAEASVVRERRATSANDPQRRKRARLTCVWAHGYFCAYTPLKSYALLMHASNRNCLIWSLLVIACVIVVLYNPSWPFMEQRGSGAQRVPLVLTCSDKHKEGHVLVSKIFSTHVPHISPIWSWNWPMFELVSTQWWFNGVFRRFINKGTNNVIYWHLSSAHFFFYFAIVLFTLHFNYSSFLASSAQ